MPFLQPFNWRHLILSEATKLIELEVSGEDDPNGSGLNHYELWVSAIDAVFQKRDITIPDSLSSYVFEGEYGTEYAFYVLGVDRTGNREIKNGAEATSGNITTAGNQSGTAH